MYYQGNLWISKTTKPCCEIDPTEFGYSINKNYFLFPKFNDRPSLQTNFTNPCRCLKCTKMYAHAVYWTFLALTSSNVRSSVKILTRLHDFSIEQEMFCIFLLLHYLIHLIFFQLWSMKYVDILIDKLFSTEIISYLLHSSWGVCACVGVFWVFNCSHNLTQFIHFMKNEISDKTICDLQIPAEYFEASEHLGLFFWL